MAMLLVVSGASRGFGRAIATAFCTNSNKTKPVRAILTARSTEGLEETKAEIMLSMASDGENRGGTASNKKSSINISTHAMDLGDLDTLEGNLDELIETAKPFAQYDRIVIVNNAGSLGHIGNVTDLPSMSSIKDLAKVINLNVTSSVWFTTRWAKELESNTKATIVNISSLCAVQAFPTMTTYCAGKAARDMFHESLAKESPLLKILNYAPGAMDTSMTDILREDDQLADGLKDYFRGTYEKGELIDPTTSAKKLMQLVLSGDYESGKHVDYWDLESPQDP